jgi:hypothetical protein
MRTRAVRVIVIILTLLIGVAIITEIFFFFRPSRELGVYLVKPVGRMIQPKYKQLGHACGGSYYSYITGYEAPDGVIISESCAPFRSPSEAKRGLRERLKYAISILERGAKYNDNGRKVGERVVALFNSKEAGKRVVLVLWTEKEDMYEVESYSLSHAVEFERTRHHYIAR